MKPERRTPRTGKGERRQILELRKRLDQLEVITASALGALAYLNSVGSSEISDEAVILSKLAPIATARFLGRITAGAGAPEELTVAQATALLDEFTGSLQGATPASGGGTDNFLRADGAWAEPPGDGAVECYYPIWAEENGPLATATFEWAYGNGADTPSNRGIVIFVPSGLSAEVVGMSLSINGGTAQVEINLNGTNQGASANIAIDSGNKTTKVLSTPLSLSNGDVLNFRTQAATGSSGPCHVCAWVRMFTT